MNIKQQHNAKLVGCQFKLLFLSDDTHTYFPLSFYGSMRDSSNRSVSFPQPFSSIEKTGLCDSKNLGL